MLFQEADCIKAAALIKSGGIVAFPTETVYGLGADCFNEKAVAGIFAVKERPSFDPLIVHIHDMNQLDILAENMPRAARILAETFWPGPLTIVVPKKASVPDIVTAGLPNVAVRMPNNRIALELIRHSGTPIAAPSANKFGRISPTCASHVREQLGSQVEIIIDGGPCSVGIESTIVSFVDKKPLLLRPGGVPVEEIEKTIGPIGKPEMNMYTHASPGRSLRHYSPRTPVFLGATPLILPGLRKGLLTFTPEPEYVISGFLVVETLSARGDLNEAACNLFAALHRLDHKNLDVIIAKKFPDVGLGVAINDRLIRASQPKRKGMYPFSEPIRQ